MRPRTAALAAALASVIGCAGLWGSLELAPNGLPMAEEELRRDLLRGRPDAALERLEDGEGDPGDELLRLQFEGALAHYAGDYRRSNEALQRAVELTEDRYTKRVSRAILSMLTGDRALAYVPSTSERLLVHYYGALNYLALGDPAEAAVEARRLAYLLERSDGDAGDEPGPGRSLRRSLGLFAGAVFLAAGERNDAAVALRRAGFRDSLDVDDRPGRAVERSGELVVLVERGAVAHRAARSLNLLVWPDEMRRLRAAEAAGEAGSQDTAAATALIIARRALAGGVPESRTVRPWTRRPYVGRRRHLEGDGVPRLLRVAWAEVRVPPVPREALRLRVTAETASAPVTRSASETGRAQEPEPVRAGQGPLVRADLSAAVASELRSEAPEMLARALLRAVVKQGLTELVEEEVSEEDEALGEVVGTAANVALSVLERADTRSWHLLPGRIEVHRLRLPEGSQQIEVLGVGGVRRDTAVDVRAGATTILSVRMWQAEGSLEERAGRNTDAPRG